MLDKLFDTSSVMELLVEVLLNLNLVTMSAILSATSDLLSTMITFSSNKFLHFLIVEGIDPAPVSVTCK